VSQHTGICPLDIKYAQLATLIVNNRPYKLNVDSINSGSGFMGAKAKIIILANLFFCKLNMHSFILGEFSILFLEGNEGYIGSRIGFWGMGKAYNNWGQ
jgi:hypothetical protein